MCNMLIFVSFDSSLLTYKNRPPEADYSGASLANLARLTVPEGTDQTPLLKYRKQGLGRVFSPSVPCFNFVVIGMQSRINQPCEQAYMKAA